MDGVVLPIVGQRVEVTGIVALDDKGKLLIEIETLRPIPPMDDPYMY